MLSAANESWPTSTACWNFARGRPFLPTTRHARQLRCSKDFSCMMLGGPRAFCAANGGLRKSPCHVQLLNPRDEPINNVSQTVLSLFRMCAREKEKRERERERGSSLWSSVLKQTHSPDEQIRTTNKYGQPVVQESVQKSPRSQANCNTNKPTSWKIFGIISRLVCEETSLRCKACNLDKYQCCFGERKRKSKTSKCNPKIMTRTNWIWQTRAVRASYMIPKRDISAVDHVSFHQFLRTVTFGGAHWLCDVTSRAGTGGLIYLRSAQYSFFAKTTQTRPWEFAFGFLCPHFCFLPTRDLLQGRSWHQFQMHRTAIDEQEIHLWKKSHFNASKLKKIKTLQITPTKYGNFMQQTQ